MIVDIEILLAPFPTPNSEDYYRDSASIERLMTRSLSYVTALKTFGWSVMATFIKAPSLGMKDRKTLAAEKLGGKQSHI